MHVAFAETAKPACAARAAALADERAFSDIVDRAYDLTPEDIANRSAAHAAGATAHWRVSDGETNNRPGLNVQSFPPQGGISFYRWAATKG